MGRAAITAARPISIFWKDRAVAKGQKKSNKEIRKPKKDAGKKGNAAAPSARGLGPKE